MLTIFCAHWGNIHSGTICPDKKVITAILALLYASFPPQETRELAEWFEIHHTPKHGSWFNMAELELRILSRQCLSRRIPTIEQMSDEVEAWVTQRNQAQSTVHWQFTTTDARIKLQYLYQKFYTSGSTNLNKQISLLPNYGPHAEPFKQFYVLYIGIRWKVILPEFRSASSIHQYFRYCDTRCF
jgi:hypothetical protein